MVTANHWLLPDGIDELLPPQAQALEKLRRKLLDLYDSWGYELIMPPHIEYLESLQAGVGGDLDLMTFKLTDQLSGRMMGLRADITPAAARIDAHKLQAQGPVRLCYAGSVYHTKPAGLGASRCPIQIGAELYGHSGSASDIEIISLLLETLQQVKLPEIYLEVGHVAIYRELVALANLSKDHEQQLFDALQKKALFEVKALVNEQVEDKNLRNVLIELPRLHGSIEVLERAKNYLSFAPESVNQAFDELNDTVRRLVALYPKQQIFIDLGQLHGYNYHTGILFSAYLASYGQAIARGGRYDGIGGIFGQARPATGFSCDLKSLLPFVAARPIENGIWAPLDADRDLVAKLRSQGERVICQLPGSDCEPEQLGCDRILFREGQAWQVKRK